MGLQAFESGLEEIRHGLDGGIVVLVLGRKIARIRAVETSGPLYFRAVLGSPHHHSGRVEADRERLNILGREAIGDGHGLLIVAVEALDQRAASGKLDLSLRASLRAALRLARRNGLVPVGQRGKIADDRPDGFRLRRDDD